MYMDTKLIALLRKGRGTKAHNRALATIYQKYYPTITRRLSSGRFIGLASIAEDLYTQSVIILEENALQGKPIHHIEAYLWKTAKFKAWHWIRRNAQAPNVVQQTQSADQSIQPNEQLVAEQCQQLFEQIKPYLGESCSTLLLLKANGYTAPEIADKLAYTSKSRAAVVRVRIQKCRKRLEKIVNNHPHFQQTISELF